MVRVGPGPPPCSVGSPPRDINAFTRDFTFWQLRFSTDQPIYDSLTENHLSYVACLDSVGQAAGHGEVAHETADGRDEGGGGRGDEGGGRGDEGGGQGL